VSTTTTTWPTLAHLDRLSEIVRVDGADLMLTAVYAEAPDYTPRGADGEGLACLDDVARAVLVYLDHHRDTGAAASLARARAGLNLVLHLQDASGGFANFVLDRNARVNLDGPTSRVGMGWWAFRGMWALGRGHASLRGVDPAYAARLLAAYQRAEQRLHSELRNVGRTSTMHGFTVPAWLPDGAGDATAVAVLALAEHQGAAPNARTAALLRALADGLVGLQLGSARAFPWHAHPPMVTEPGFWHAWGSHQAHALACAGRVLGEPRYVASACRELDHLVAWQVVAGRVQELGALPHPAGQQAYGTSCLVQAATETHLATGKARYALLAGLLAGWFHGDNAAGEPMFDPVSGRGFDGIDGGGVEQGGRVNRNAGAESTIEALTALRAVGRVPTAAMYQHHRVVERHTWRILAAEHARPTAGRPMTGLGGWTGEARFSGRPVELSAHDAVEWPVDIDVPGAYVLYIAHVRRVRRKGAFDTALQLQLDDGHPWTVPVAVSPDRDHLWLDLVTPEPVVLARGRHRLQVTLRGPAGPTAVVDGMLLHPAIAHAVWRGPTGDMLRLDFERLTGRLHVTDLPVRPS